MTPDELLPVDLRMVIAGTARFPRGVGDGPDSELEAAPSRRVDWTGEDVGSDDPPAAAVERLGVLEMAAPDTFTVLEATGVETGTLTLDRADVAESVPVLALVDPDTVVDAAGLDTGALALD